MRALEADSRNAEAHYNLGLMEDETDNRTQALAHYRSFLQYGAAIHPTLVGEVRKRIEDLESKNWKLKTRIWFPDVSFRF